MILQETYTLPNGVEIPRLGLGTWMIGDEDVEQAVQDAIAEDYGEASDMPVFANP